MEGCSGPLLWFPQSGDFGGAFDDLSSAWRLHCEAGTPIRRVLTLACGQWSRLGVLSSFCQGKSESLEFSEQCS